MFLISIVRMTNFTLMFEFWKSCQKIPWLFGMQSFLYFKTSDAWNAMLLLCSIKDSIQHLYVNSKIFDSDSFKFQ